MSASTISLAELLAKAGIELPLHAGPHYKHDVLDVAGRTLATASPGFSPASEAKAAVIVHAVNAHQSLVEACELFTQAAHDVRDALNGAGIACPSSIAFAAERAREALRKARSDA